MMIRYSTARIHALESRRLLSAGDLDPTFGTDGRSSNPAMERGKYRQTIVLSDNKILAGGVFVQDSPSKESYLLARFNADGTPDPTFGTDGVSFGDIPIAKQAGLVQIKVEADGQIIALASGGSKRPVLVRFNSDGSLDNTFSTDGAVPLPISAQSLASRADGKIIVSGLGYDTSKTIVMRYDTNGAIDTDFGVNGFSTAAQDQLANPRETIVLSNNKILVGGDVVDGLAAGTLPLMQLTADGTIDDSFETVSTVLSPALQVQKMIVLPSGKIIAAGPSASGVMVARFNDDGTVDGTFGEPGIEIAFSGSSQIQSLQADLNSNIVVIAEQGNQTRVARVDPDGALDELFGRVIPNYQLGVGSPAGGGVQADGNVIVVDNKRSDKSSPTTIISRMMGEDPNPSPIRVDDTAHHLIITGTSGNDLIQMARQGTARLFPVLNGFSRIINITDVNQLEINCGAGDDTVDIAVSSAAASISGGDGKDRVVGTPFNDTILGNAGKDFLDGFNGSDLISGNGGNDKLQGQGGADRLYGGPGNDYIGGNGNDQFFTEDSLVDTLFGDSGADIARGDDIDLLTSVENTL